MKKNDKVELNIIDMTNEGLGVSRLNSQVFFVKDALLGDKVEAVVTKVGDRIIYAKMTSIIEESPYRIVAKCNVADACGGCKLLSLRYSKQLELKKKYALTCMSKIGKLDIDESVYQGIIGVSDQYNFRNKMQIPYTVRHGEIIYGFYAGRTHHIVEFENCITGFNGAKIILDAIKVALKKFNLSIYNEKTGDGIFREVMLRKGNETDEVSITYILQDINYKKNLNLYKEFDKHVVSVINAELNHSGDIECRDQGPILNLVTSTININVKNNNTIFGNENVVIRGKGYIEDKIGDLKYHISPESFYQVNNKMTKTLYDIILEYGDFKCSETILDLYCGIGTISLYLAKKVKSVIGIEIGERAVENAWENIEINDIKNASFIVADLENNNYLSEERLYKELKCKIDTIVVDPPRKGLDLITIDFIRNINANKIIYVSCNPATLARDIDSLCNSDLMVEDGEQKPIYKLISFVNVDMFPHTMHVETVVLLSKAN